MKKRARMRYPQQLSSLMPGIISEMGLAAKLREAEIWRVWPDVVGRSIAAQAQPLRIIGGVLTVAVSSAAWLQELNYLKGKMISRLNERLEGEVVREIVLRSGRVASGAAAEAESEPVKRALSSEQESEIAGQAAAIEDPETREAFVALMKASLESVRR